MPKEIRLANFSKQWRFSTVGDNSWFINLSGMLINSADSFDSEFICWRGLTVFYQNGFTKRPLIKIKIFNFFNSISCVWILRILKQGILVPVWGHWYRLRKLRRYFNSFISWSFWGCWGMLSTSRGWLALDGSQFTNFCKLFMRFTF